MKYKLKSVVWEITLACCFSCKYCGSAGGHARDKELTTEECLDIAQQLSDMSCRRVSLIGGEVFMRGDWRTIVKRLTDLGIKTGIITNGYIMTDEILADLKTLGLESIAVSIDGPEKIHDKYRQEGSFSRALQTIESLTEAGIPVSVISTLNAENVTHLEELLDILRNTGIFAWQLQACSPMGNAAKSVNAADSVNSVNSVNSAKTVNVEDSVNAVNAVIDYAFDFNIPIRFVEKHLSELPFALGVADNIGYFTDTDSIIRGNRGGGYGFAGCSAGLSSIGIDSVGNVRGCESMYADEFIEGNLRTQSLQEIWDNPEGFAYNRNFNMDMLSGKCAACEHSRKCAGGCRSYNYFVHKKMYESPACVYKKCTNY